ncbi:MAG TPA: nitroreductase family deazaflavin-dependent oxidoreductase [Ktedonobacteraceae bacterium]|jgi:deazaflavin-dependent oxidoreductase (nitroreductase family)
MVSRTQMTHRRPLASRLTRLLNPLILARAGSRHSPFAVLHHRGRRSGRVYTTPTSARPTSDGFVIPLTFGTGADWFQNIQAAGECTIQWKGTHYAMTEPVVIERAVARLAFSPLERALLPLIGVEQFVRLRHTPTGQKQTSA